MKIEEIFLEKWLRWQASQLLPWHCLPNPGDYWLVSLGLQVNDLVSVEIMLVPSSIRRFILFLLVNFTASEEERFFWESDYVGKPINFYHGAAYQIPVIEGERVDIQCKVRAVSEDIYTIIWDYENFHANTTGKTILVNNTDGDEYAQDTITVTIDNPADIDDRDMGSFLKNIIFRIQGW